MSVVYVSAFPPEGLVDRLEQRGLPTRLSVDQYANSLDHRLQVTAPRGGVQVELLGPLAQLDDLPCWHAVRVANGDRAVWCGPPRTCDEQQLCDFLLELQVAPPDDLAKRWQRLG